MMNSPDPLISVIIPVFNSRPFFRACLLSLLSQTYSNYEIIIVDDGSTDGSLDEVSDLLDHKFIAVLKQSNKGPSAARNMGLSAAHGTYICFVDSDDIVDSHYLEWLCNGLIESQAIVVACNFSTFGEAEFSGPIPVRQKGWTPINAQLFWAKFEKEPLFCASLWNKMFAASALKSLSFVPGVVCEDLLFVQSVVKPSCKIVWIDSTLYYYRVRSGSITRTHSVQNYADCIRAYLQLALFFKNELCTDNYSGILDNVIEYYLQLLTVASLSMHKRERRNFCRRIRLLVQQQACLLKPKGLKRNLKIRFLGIYSLLVSTAQSTIPLF